MQLEEHAAHADNSQWRLAPGEHVDHELDKLIARRHEEDASRERANQEVEAERARERQRRESYRLDTAEARADFHEYLSKIYTGRAEEHRIKAKAIRE
jgi:hypothetical protein